MVVIVTVEMLLLVLVVMVTVGKGLMIAIVREMLSVVVCSNGDSGNN